jgi:excisionase family DNA binding protein
MMATAEVLVTARSIAEATSLEPETILQLARENRIPAYRLGRKIVRFRLSEVLGALEASRNSGKTEVQQ